MEDFRCGHITREKFMYRTEYLISSSFAISSTKELKGEFQRVHFADLFCNKLLVTTDLSSFLLYDLKNNGPLEPTEGFLPSFTKNSKLCLPCFTWGSHGNFILGSGSSNNIAILDTNRLKLIKKINLMKNQKPTIRCSTFGHETSPFNDNLTAVACKNGYVPIFDLRTGDTELIIGNKLLDISSIAWSKFNEPIIATTCTNTESLKIWDIRNFRHHQTSLHFHSTSLPDLKFTDSSTIVSLNDKSLDVIDLLKEKHLYSIEISRNRINSTRKYRFSVNYNNPKLIYFPSGNELKVLDIQKTRVINSFYFSNIPTEMAIFNQRLQEIYVFPNNKILDWK